MGRSQVQAFLKEWAAAGRSGWLAQGCALGAGVLWGLPGGAGSAWKVKGGLPSVRRGLVRGGRWVFQGQKWPLQRPGVGGWGKSQQGSGVGGMLGVRKRLETFRGGTQGIAESSPLGSQWIPPAAHEPLGPRSSTPTCCSFFGPQRPHL